MIKFKLKKYKNSYLSRLGFRPLTSSILKTIFDGLFNLINSLNNMIILDLFAGVGRFGLYILQKWKPKKIFFIEISKCICDNLSHNLKKFSYNTKIINCSALNIKLKNIIFDIIFIDPPFNQSQLIYKSIKYIIKKEMIHKNTLFIIRSNSNFSPNLNNVYKLTNGKSHIFFISFKYIYNLFQS